MADEQKNNESEGVLVGAAKAIGAVAGKVASLTGAASGQPAKAEYKEGTYAAQYLGSGTFVISKPKRKEAKRRQSKLKGTVRGARK